MPGVCSPRGGRDVEVSIWLIHNCSKSHFCTNFINEWRQKFFIQAQWKSLWLKQQFMKSDQKCNCNVSNACLCLDRSANQFSFSLAIFDWSPQKTLMLNVQPSNLSICAPAKIAWGWICWTVKTFCCVVVEVPTWFSSEWAYVPGSLFRIADISRCRFRDVDDFVYERRWKIWTKEGRAHWQVCFQLL